MILHDGVGHHPLGAASYYFKDDIALWVAKLLPKDKIIISVGAQPNSSPHMGNICNLGTAFALGEELVKTGNPVSISFDAVDTAPAPDADGPIYVNGIKYQKSLRHSGVDAVYLKHFKEILGRFSAASGVPFQERRQADILKNPKTGALLREIISHHKTLGPLLSPKTGCIGVRAACPVEGCGLAEKGGILNKYFDDRIEFHCPNHGPHVIDLFDPEAVSRIELNTPMRNILRNYLFAQDPTTDWVRVIGSDYAGFYQEQLLWRPLLTAAQPIRPPVIVYSPAIQDWSGAKLSKSLYVHPTAYDYLRGSDLQYMLSYEGLAEHPQISLEMVYSVCRDWIEEPYRLFRAYSLHHLHDLLMAKRS